MPCREKVSAEERVEMIRKYEAGEVSIGQAARCTGVDKATIRRWIVRYKEEGAAGFLRYEQNRVYPPEMKRQAVEDYLAGRGSLLEISKKYKLRHERQLYDWVKVYHAHGDFDSRKYSGGGRAT